MFTDLLDQPRKELEALRAQCAAQEKRLEKLESLVVKCAEQEERLEKLESMVVPCARNSRTSIISMEGNSKNIRISFMGGSILICNQNAGFSYPKSICYRLLAFGKVLEKNSV